MLFVVRRIAFRVANPKIAHDLKQLKNESRIPFYPVVGLKEVKTGAMILNKPDNNNNVTQQCADQLFRFLNTYHHDHTVENVWIQNRGPSFSGGADLEQLVKNPDYLDKLMRLSIKLGQFNKPIFAKVHGSARGIAAYILTMFSTPLGTDRSSLRLDETAKGFIPIFGGSHKLSRLPCNIGIYLALTGDRLDADQMNRLSFLKGRVRDQFTHKQIRKHLSDANLFMRNPYNPSSHSLSEVRRQNLILYKKNYFNDMVSATQQQIFKSGGNFNSKLALNQYRVAQTDYYNTIQPYNSFSQKNIVLNNYFQMRHDRPFNYLKEKGIVEQGKTFNNLISRLPVHKLIKVFNQNSIQQVLEQLKKDQSQWARKTQELIRMKDPLAVHLTFNLLKKAKTLTWVECLQEQYKIARRLLNMSKITHKQISGNRSLIVLQNTYSKQKIENISQQIIEKFMKPAEIDTQKFDHDTPNHSFFPTSQYWKQIPDAGRNYLNRTFFQDYHAKFGQIEAVRFLNANKIDYRDSSYNISTLRQYMYKKFDYEKLLQLQRQRIRGIFQSELFYSQLKQQRNAYLKQQLQRKDLPKLISQQIQLYFQQRFKTRFEQLEKTAKIAGKESRLNIIRKYINTLTENIVFNGRKIEDVDRKNNAKHLGIIRFDQKNSDVFNAQNQHELSYPELNTLKRAYKNNKNKDDLKDIDPQKQKQTYMFFDNKLTPEELSLIKRDAALKLNYNYDKLLTQQKAIDYRMLMQSAANTSEQIAGLLGWENIDIQAMIVNSPAKTTTFKQFAQKTLDNSKKIQQRITNLNNLYSSLIQYKQNQLTKSLQPVKQTDVGNVFFDSNIIPQQFRDAHLGLFEEVLNFYSGKYKVNDSISTGFSFNRKDQKQSIIDSWVKQGLKQSFSKLMKSDVEYTFSYLVILHLKQILSQLQNIKNKNMADISQYVKNRFGINLTNLTFNQFNNLFMKYLYSVLDLHEQSKHKIIFPQTKIIEFINQFKINAELKDRANLSFQSLMLLIGKDRKMIRDIENGTIPLLGYDPQVNLNTVATEQQQNNTAMPKIKQITSNSLKNLSVQQAPQLLPIFRMSNLMTNLAAHQAERKSLILGFPHYLRRFQAMMQQVAGRTMFLPKQLYDCQSKKTYEIAKDLLKIEQNNEQWFKTKLRSAVKSVMDFRYEKEKQMSQGQLKIFDQQFSQLFSPDMIGVLIKYQTYTQQVIAKLISKQQRKSQGTNETIHNHYLDLKSQIKNPRALKIFNNLIMAENVIKDRIDDIEQIQYKRSMKDTVVTRQQQIDLAPQRGKLFNVRTYQRLIFDALRYPDDDNGVNKKNIMHMKNSLGVVKQSKDKTYLREIKNISKLLDASDLKTQLQDRIKRIQVV